MKNCLKHMIKTMLSIMLILGMLTACGSSEPCNACGNSPTKSYKNELSGKKEYYCDTCSSRCALCSGKATKHYTAGIGVLFVCDSCYVAIQEFSS